jgi:hypothetical protein
VFGDRLESARRRRDDSDRAEVRRRVAQSERQVIDSFFGGGSSDRSAVLRVGRDADADTQPGSGSPDGPQHLPQKTGPVTPDVLAAIECRIEELLDQVPMRGRDLDPVQTALGRKLSGTPVAGDDLVDLPGACCARLDAEARARNSRGSERRRTGRCRDLLPASVEQLDEETGAGRLDRRRDTAISRHQLRQITPERVRGQET